MVDRFLLASKIAAVRDAIARIRQVLPPDAEAFVGRSALLRLVARL